MDIKKLINEGNEKWIKSFQTQNASLFSSIFMENGCLLNSDGSIICGKDNIKKRIENYMKEVGPCDIEIETLNIFPIDDLIYETGKYKYIFNNKNTSSGKYLVIWKIENNTAYILKDVGLPDKKDV